MHERKDQNYDSDQVDSAFMYTEHLMCMVHVKAINHDLNQEDLTLANGISLEMRVWDILASMYFNFNKSNVWLRQKLFKINNERRAVSGLRSGGERSE